VHDISEIERLGIPAVMVASSQFVHAARVQADALGVDPARVFVEHPIQDRTDEELRALADEVFDEIVGWLTGVSRNVNGAPDSNGPLRGEEERT
jgi:hypothetical protein